MTTKHSSLARKRVLLLAVKTGYQTRQFVAAAEKLGLKIAFATDRCERMDDPWGDHALPLHFFDPQASARQVVEFARDNPVDAIVAIGDRPTPTAAHACRALNLLHNSPEAAEACRTKSRQRALLSQAGFPIPAHRQFPIGSQPTVAAAQVEYPCVLKPLALSGSRGVIRANNPEEFIAAFERIRCLLERSEIQVLREETSNFLQVEKFLPGQEVALEGILTEGRLKTLAIFDKPDPLDGPFFEETIYVTPTRMAAGEQTKIRETVQEAVTALGLTQGSVHAELRWNSEGPWVLEIAARCIGGLCARVLRFSGGASLEEVILRHALGEDISSREREEQAAGVMMIPIPAAGYYEGVGGEEEAGSVSGIEEIVITAKPGQTMEPLPEGSSYLGFIFARAATPAEAEAALRAAHGKLDFRFAPILPVVAGP